MSLRLETLRARVLSSLGDVGVFCPPELDESPFPLRVLCVSAVRSSFSKPRAEFSLLTGYRLLSAVRRSPTMSSHER